ncbi:flagellar basal body rod modification protein [Roseateles sp. DAIF2]|uniref:flagellar hook capping FlgD N-terminal domain-containing protein n=1 Tax=Roseateles sp. DAIF2 TaxID=2714952 RepID=UPI0018A2B2F2|nr:flagellar hook capping FlgD N-terminal domain-containing protein [Roseateles sp. DAIF2]QPF74152.1 flagellar basal body rod modification protein [Roseateles sp. DAIF2]
MTTVSDVNKNSQAGGAASQAIGANGSISNMFTTLLVAQIKNQDPLSPTDPSQFVGQLTQLSQMEALQALSSQGAANASMLSSLQMISLGAQVGSTVQAKVEQLELGKDKVATHFTLASGATPATLVLSGADGIEKRVDLGTRAIGNHAYTLDPAALGLPAGRYQLRVENESKQATALEVVATMSNVRLTGDGGAMVSLGSFGEVSPAAITQFKGRPGQQQAAN